MKINKLIIKIGLLFLYNIQVFAQPNSISISFASRSNTYGEPLKLDSILIKNISKNCDTILYSPDTVLQLYYIVGINNNKERKNSFYISNCKPNPVKYGKTGFSIFLQKKSKVYFRLSNINGEIILKRSFDLNEGYNKFTLSVPTRGMFLLTAFNGREYQSIKVINNNPQGFISPQIVFISNNNRNEKSIHKNKTLWEFEPGDTLWYVSYSLTPQNIKGSDVIEDVPEKDSLIRFRIIEGIPCPEVVAVKYGGYLYPTVQIKDRCWLKESLRIGTMIPGDSAMSNNGIIEKYCYDNNPDNCDEYGALYQWDELMCYTTQEKTKGICPNGWHVPSIDEFNSMTQGYTGDDFKERGNLHWHIGSYGMNTTGFTALPGGIWNNYSKVFQSLGEASPFYTSTKLSPPYFGVYYKEFIIGSIMIWGNIRVHHGLSIRCIKDE